MPLQIFFGNDNTGTQVVASNIELTTMLDGKDVLIFNVDSIAQLASLTQKAAIFCQYSYDTTTQALFNGFIDMVSTTFPYQVTAIGVIGKMEWYIVEENNSDLVFAEGSVKQVNSGDATRLDLYDNEGNAITDTTAYANPTNQNIYYLIVSDATRSTNTVNLQNGANDWIGYSDAISPGAWGTETNDFTAVDNSEATDNDATQWTVTNTSNTLAWYTEYVMQINLDLVQYTIPKTATMTKLSVRGYFEVLAGPKFLLHDTTNLRINVRTYGTAVGYWAYQQFSINPKVIGNTLLGCPIAFDIDFPNIFTDGDNYKEGGAIQLVFYWNKALNDPATFTPDLTVAWHCLKATVEYETATFDTLNHPITFTEAGDTIGTANNYTTSGVAPNDKWMIGVDYNVALSRAFSAQYPTEVPSGIDIKINQGTAIGLGIAKNYFGSLGFEMMDALRKDIDYHYWAQYDPTTIYIDKTTNMRAAATLTTPNHGSMAMVEQYCPAQIAVVWKDGIEFAPTSVSGAQGLIKFQDQSILTAAEAYSRAVNYATRYANLTYAIELKYTGGCILDSSNSLIPTVGGLYTVTLNTDDGSTAEYTEPLRRMTIMNNGADEYYDTMIYLGLGSTPLFEKIPKEIEQLKRQHNQNQIVQMSSTYTPATRHQALNGILGSTEGYHLSATNFTAITNDTYDADKVDSCDVETAAITNDATKLPTSALVYAVKTTADNSVQKSGANTVTDTFGLTPTTTNTNSIGGALAALAALYSRIVQSDDDLTIQTSVSGKGIKITNTADANQLINTYGGGTSRRGIIRTHYGNSSTGTEYLELSSLSGQQIIDYRQYLSIRGYNSSALEVLRLNTSVASAVNRVGITNSATGNPPILAAEGTDTDIHLLLQTKGTGHVLVKDEAANFESIEVDDVTFDAGGTPSSLKTVKTTADAALPASGGKYLMPNMLFGLAGFIESELTAAVLYVTDSDSNAYIVAKFITGLGGSYKVLIVSTNSANSITNSGVLTVGQAGDGEARGSFVLLNAVNFDLVNNATAGIYKYTYSDAFTIPADSIVNVKWLKDAAEAGDILYIHLVALVKQ
jgi:hypothetical protein